MARRRASGNEALMSLARPFEADKNGLDPMSGLDKPKGLVGRLIDVVLLTRILRVSFK